MAKKIPARSRRSSPKNAIKSSKSAKIPADRCTAYAKAVVSGEMVAGPLVRLACERHLRDLKEGARRGLRWDLETANDAISFFERFLRFYDGEHAGEPFILSLFQCFIVGSLWGWKGADGYRRFRTAYVETGKGSGKSPLAAGLGILGLVADGEPGAEIYSAAVIKDQAKILFRDAEQMVQASPELLEIVDRHVNNLSVAETASFFRPISSEKRGLDGKRPHIVLIDEIHEHPSSVVVDKMRAGTKGRRQALIFEITNSGYDRTSVCWHHHEYSEKVLRGVIANDSWFAYVCALDEGDDWTDPAVWPKANPNLGVSIPYKYLDEQVAEARGIPSKENIVKRLNFCIWTEQAERWMPMERWDACDVEFTPDDLRGEVCFGGLDLASTGDFAAFCRMFPPTDERDLWCALWRFYIPEAKLEERIRKDPGHQWAVWRAQGKLLATPGDITDYDLIHQDILEQAEACQLREIAYDRWNATQLITQLGNDGITMTGFGQGYTSMNAPVTELMKLVLRKDFAHGNDPVARWMVSNAATEQDPAGLLKLSKRRSSEKIDGIVALAMALGRAMPSNDKSEAIYSDAAQVVI